MRRSLSVAGLSLVSVLVTAAQNSQPVRIDRIAWLAGRWRGQAFGGEVEEIWNPPAGGMMTGMFRLIDKGKVTFMEFEQIVEQENSLVFKVKHFTPAFVGWEEKEKAVEFKLLSAGENELRFDGLTVVNIDPDTCEQIVKLKDKATNETEDVEFLYHRVKN